MTNFYQISQKDFIKPHTKPPEKFSKKSTRNTKKQKPHKNHAKTLKNPLNHLKFRPFVSVKAFAFENYVSGVFPSGVLVDIHKVKTHIAH